MIDDDRGDKNNSSDVMQSRPNSGLFSKRSLPVTDDDVGLILSSRVKKFSVEIPSAQLDFPSEQRSRLRVLICDHSPENYTGQLDRKDFQHLLGEANGKQYDDCGRPELEIHSILLGERVFSLLAREKDMNEDENGSIPVLLKGIRSISFIFDPAKQAYVLSDQVQSVLLMCMYMNARGPQRLLDVLALSSAECKFGQETYSVLDSFRQRLWRRALREHIEPVLSNSAKMETVIQVFLDAATQAVTTNDGFLPDHRAEEVVSEPDRAAEEAEEAELLRLAAEAVAAVSHRRKGGRKASISSTGRRGGLLQANLTQPRASGSSPSKRTSSPPPSGVGSNRRSSIAPGKSSPTRE